MAIRVLTEDEDIVPAPARRTAVREVSQNEPVYSTIDRVNPLGLPELDEAYYEQQEPEGYVLNTLRQFPARVASLGGGLLQRAGSMLQPVPVPGLKPGPTLGGALGDLLTGVGEDFSRIGSNITNPAASDVMEDIKKENYWEAVQGVPAAIPPVLMQSLPDMLAMGRAGAPVYQQAIGEQMNQEYLDKGGQDTTGGFLQTELGSIGVAALNKLALDELMKGLGTGIVPGAIRGTAAEAPTESGQEVLEYLATTNATNEPLSAKAAKDKAIAGALLGGGAGAGMGAAVGAFERPPEPDIDPKQLEMLLRLLSPDAFQVEQDRRAGEEPIIVDREGKAGRREDWEGMGMDPSAPPTVEPPAGPPPPPAGPALPAPSVLDGLGDQDLAFLESLGLDLETLRAASPVIDQAAAADLLGQILSPEFRAMVDGQQPIQVNAEGVATTPEQRRQAEADELARQQERENLGLTPDIERAQQRNQPPPATEPGIAGLIPPLQEPIDVDAQGRAAPRQQMQETRARELQEQVGMGLTPDVQRTIEQRKQQDALQYRQEPPPEPGTEGYLKSYSESPEPPPGRILTRGDIPPATGQGALSAKNGTGMKRAKGQKQTNPEVTYTMGGWTFSVPNPTRKFEDSDRTALRYWQEVILMQSPDWQAKRSPIAQRGLADDLGVKSNDRRQQTGTGPGGIERRVADRRANMANRKRIDELTEEEAREELRRHPLTGLRSKRAYEEDEKMPVQASIDVDSLKWFNDNAGHEAGDQLLQTVAEAIAEQTDNGYHLSGDEFAMQGQTAEEIDAIVQRVNARLAEATIEAQLPDGTVVTLQGPQITHTTGSTYADADSRLGAEKERRADAGLRARRGEQPSGARIRPPVSQGPGSAQGQQDPEREAAADEGVDERSNLEEEDNVVDLTKRGTFIIEVKEDGEWESLTQLFGEDMEFDSEEEAQEFIDAEVDPQLELRIRRTSSKPPSSPLQYDIDEEPQPGARVPKGNRHGFEKALRVWAFLKGRKLPKKASILQATNDINVARQIAALDDILARHPDAHTSAAEWANMMAWALASQDVPVPPYAFLKQLADGTLSNKIGGLTPGQIADADHGFRAAAEFRRAYTSGKATPATTGKLFLWSFLSRGVNPYTQESLFIDGFYGVDRWIQMAAAGTFGQRELAQYLEWTDTVAGKGSGVPGSGALHNLKAFGRNWLMKMAERTETGKTKLQTLHDMLGDPKSTGPEIRRAYHLLAQGTGIDNKVISFTLLVSGFQDVMVLDRVQIRQLWDDGKFSDRNLYDGENLTRLSVKDGPTVRVTQRENESDAAFKRRVARETVKLAKAAGVPTSKVDAQRMTITGTSLADLTTGARGLLIYEAIERGLDQNVKKIYADAGRPKAASIGRFHWESWVWYSQQEASHGTIDAILAQVKGANDPLDGVTAKQGEYGNYDYGARYGIDTDGTRVFRYTTPDGATHKFSVPAFREFLAQIKRPANGVIPTGFKVTESGNGPWYNRPEVDQAKLAEIAAATADRGTVQGRARGGRARPATVQQPAGGADAANRSKRAPVKADLAEGSDEDADSPALAVLRRQLARRLKQVGIDDVIAGKVVERLELTMKGGEKRTARGAYHRARKLITVALTNPRQQARTINHEIIHALRDLGVLTDAEWRVLSRAAKANEEISTSVRRRYGKTKLDEEGLVEEMVADLHGAWVVGRYKPTKGIERVLQKIRQFLERLGNALRGAGFQSAEDVFNAIDRGEVGARLVRDEVDGYELPPEAEQASLPDNWISRLRGADLSGALKRGILEAMSAVRVVNEKMSTVKIATATVNDARQAAVAFQPLADRAQEVLAAIVTDKNGKVLQIIRHSTGTIDSAQSDSAVLLGSVLDVPRAANVWFAHNHPSGDPAQSDADKRLTRDLSSLLEDTGIEMKGMVVGESNGKTFSWYYTTGRGTAADGDFAYPVTPQKGEARVSITERVIKARGDADTAIGTPKALTNFVRNQLEPSDRGILVMDTRHQPIGFISMSSVEMRSLRAAHARGAPTLKRQILQQLHRMNGRAVAIVAHKDTVMAGANTARFLKTLPNTRLLDIVYWNDRGSVVSVMESGETGLMDHGPYYDLDEENPRLRMDHKQVTKRIPSLTEAAQKVKAGEMTGREYGNLVKMVKPVSPYSTIPTLATPAEMEAALSSDKVPFIGAAASSLKPGDLAGLRLDIPAYTNHGTWVVAVHGKRAGGSAGKRVGYESAASLTNATFGINEKVSLNIAAGKAKAPMATIEGQWVPVTPEAARARAAELLKDPEWIQVGMDPERHAFFYDRDSMEPVVAADEILQVGPLVLAKNPTYESADEFLFDLDEEAPSPGWYSALARAAASLKQEKGTPEQMLNALRNARGVKPEEIEWSGVEEYAKGLGKRITKQQLVEFLENNGVRAYETIRSGVSNRQAFNEALRETVNQVGFSTDVVEIARKYGIIFEGAGFQDGQFYLHEVLVDDASYDRAKLKITNERELAAFTRFGDAFREAYVGPSTLPAAYPGQAQQIRSNYREIVIGTPGVGPDGEQDWQGEHFSDNGYIAHTRVSDVMHNGAKYLYVEEIQSDVHQRAQKEGYYLPTSRITADDVQVERDGDEYVITFPDGSVEREMADGYVDWEQAAEQMAIWYNENNRGDEADAAPNAPFKGDAWKELMLKRLLRLAAEEGYAGLVITRGESAAHANQAGDAASEGLETYYGQVIPTLLKRMARKLDPNATVEMEPVVFDEDLGYVVRDEGTNPVLTLTDKMRDDVMEGQPLFDLDDDIEQARKAQAKMAARRRAKAATTSATSATSAPVSPGPRTAAPSTTPAQQAAALLGTYSPSGTMMPAVLRDSMLGFLRMFESASDRLRRIDMRPIAALVDQVFDYEQRNAGRFNKIMAGPIRRASAKDKERFGTWARQWDQRDNAAAAQTYAAMTARGKALVDAWKAAADMTGAENQRVGVQVFDPKLDAWRPIGRARQYFPRMMMDWVQNALFDPLNHPQDKARLVALLISRGLATDPQDAEKYIRANGPAPEKTKSDYFSGLEKARTDGWPEEVYDYSLDTAIDYGARWAERLAQIETLGQDGTKAGEVFSQVIEQVQQPELKQYLRRVQARIYNETPIDPHLRVIAMLNITATGLQLGNPRTALQNLITGTGLNYVAYGKYAAMAMDALRMPKGLVADAEAAGILRDDIMRVQRDLSESVPSALSAFTSGAMLLGGYNITERQIRLHAYLAGLHLVRDFIKQVGKNPMSPRSLKLIAWMQRNNFDYERLLAERGQGEYTDTVLRYIVNLPQGSYRINMTPVLVDEPIGRFLWKYQKYGTQVTRMAWMNHMEPFIKAVKGGEKVMVRDPVSGQMVTKRVFDFVSMLRLLALPPLYGVANKWARWAAFGTLAALAGPDWEDLDKALQDDDRRKAAALALQMAWEGMISAGVLGVFTTPVQITRDVSELARVKNPLIPPATGPLTSTVDFIQGGISQGKVTARDIDLWANRTFSLYNATVGSRPGRKLQAEMGFVDKPALETYRLARAQAQKEVRAYADAMGLPSARRRSGGEFMPSPSYPIAKEISQEIILGRPEAAKAILREELLKLTTENERKSLRSTVVTHVRNQQPIVVGGQFVAADRRNFLSWARDNLHPDKYDRIVALDRQYRSAAVAAGMMNPEDAGRAARDDRRRDRGGQPMSEQATKRMLREWGLQ